MTRKKAKSLVDTAYSSIKERIVTLKYRPGMKLEEKYLMSELKIGRTPVREAIRILIAEGLMISDGPNSTYVKDLSIKNAKSLMDLLYCFGDLIFELAKSNTDFEPIIKNLETSHKRMEEELKKGDLFQFLRHNGNFHRMLARISNNDYLNVFFDRVYNEEMRISYMLASQKPKGLTLRQYYEEIQRQHREIIELLKSRNFEELKNVYKAHIKIAISKIFGFFDQG